MSEEAPQTSQGNKIKNSNQQPQQDEPGLGIASFVLSLWGMNILALIFGIISLNQKNSRWTAKAGVIIASIRLGLRIIFGIFMCFFFISIINNSIISDNSLSPTCYEAIKEIDDEFYPTISTSEIDTINSSNLQQPEEEGTERNESNIEQ